MLATLDTIDACDLILQECRIGVVVESQDLLQRVLTFFNQRQIVEREMRDQPPHRIFANRWADGRSRLAGANCFWHPFQAFNHKVAVFAAEWKPRWPVKVGA